MCRCTGIKISIIGLDSKIGSDVKTAELISGYFNKKPEDVTKNGVTKLCYLLKNEDILKFAWRTAEDLIVKSEIDRLKIRGVFGSSNYTAKFLIPSFTACCAKELRLKNVVCDQIGLGCAGGLQALRNCHNQAVVDFIEGKIGYYLVVVGDQISLILDRENFSTSVLFSEGVAVLLLSNNPEESKGYKIDRVGTKSLLSEHLYSLRLENPYHSLSKKNEIPKLKMEGLNVFQFAVKSFPDILDLVGLKELDDKTYFIPHQANIRIIDQIIQNNKLNPNNVYTEGIKTIGNTSGASVFFGLQDSLRNNLFDKRNKVLLGAFGAELQVGTAMLLPLEKNMSVC